MSVLVKSEKPTPFMGGRMSLEEGMMKKVYHLKDIKKPRKCTGCGKWIEKKSSCIYIFKSWEGRGYKAYYHNDRCRGV